MKKEPEKTVVSQYCLEISSLPSFIDKLPKKLKIANVTWRAVYRKERQKLLIPEYLKKFGIHQAVLEAAPLNIRGKYDTGVDRNIMRTQLAKIARHYSVPLDKFHIQNITLMHTNDLCSITFKRMYKQIRLPNDKRRKKLVLGMVRGDGKDYHDILSLLSAKKISCTMMKTEKSIVMCSEEIVVK